MRREAGRVLRGLVKESSRRTGLYRGLFFARYPYLMSPHELIALGRELEDARNVEGAIVEIGCAYGSTTVFLNKLMDDLELERPYFAIDTFAGFLPEHAEHEIRVRAKPASIRTSFTENRKEWFEETVAYWGFHNVNAIKADAAAFDYSRVGPIAFCLLDVDLYLPTAAALPGLHDALAPDGRILVHDCIDDRKYDGAYWAYREFVQRRGLPELIVGGGFGLVGRDHQALTVRSPALNTGRELARGG